MTFNFFLLIERNLLSYFEMTSSPRFGNCFSFNSNVSGSSTTTWSSSLPGQEGKHNILNSLKTIWKLILTALLGSLLGLNIVLNIEQPYYMLNGLSPSAGAR